MTLERGIFTLSLDFELIWGTLDLFGTRGFDRAVRLERGEVFDRLVALFERHGISATWCVLGHLMLGSCSPGGPQAHPEIVRPRHAWTEGDWFEHDPGADEATAPLFYGRSLVQRLLGCRVPQEIGCHSFSHVIFGDPGCSRETARSELAACVAAARELGVEMRSFAFPRNSVGHLDVLEEFGFRAYRGPGPRWYDKGGNNKPVDRLGHLADVVLAVTPPTVTPERGPHGLVNIPGSMILFPAHGVRRHVPMSLRIARVRKGIEAAIRKREVFHLWFHPTNLADGLEPMFAALDEVFALVARRSAEGVLDVRTMGQLAA